MPIYQTSDNTLLQMKEKNIDKFKPKLNKKNESYTHKNGHQYT